MEGRVARWFELRSRVWYEVAAELRAVEHGKHAAPATVRELVRSYPEIARDLAIARREAPDGALTRHLEQIYLELHRVIFRSPGNWWRDTKFLFLHGAAIESMRIRWHMIWVTALFCLSAAAGWLLVARYPELATLFASEGMVETVMSGQLWTDDLHNVLPSSVLSVQLFTNNVMVSLFAVCLGIFFGLGTFYIISLNGMMLGSIFAFTHQYGLGMRLFEWVAAHGFVELSVICVAGAVGASFGEALARPGHLTRLASFQQAVRRGLKLMVVALVFLIGAGFVEGFVSPNPNINLAGRLAVGLGYWVLFVLVMSGGLGRLLNIFRRR